MLRRLCVLLLLALLCCSVSFGEEWKVERIDAGNCWVSVQATEVGDGQLEVKVLPVPQEEDRILPEVFMLYENSEAVGVAYPAESGDSWLGYAPWLGDTLILVPVVDSA